jgi:hypothetical protein
MRVPRKLMLRFTKSKGDIKFALQRNMKGQNGSRGIALFFFNLGFGMGLG